MSNKKVYIFSRVFAHLDPLNKLFFKGKSYLIL